MREKIEIEGLNSIRRSLDEIAARLRKPIFSLEEMYEKQRHQDLLKIQNRQLIIQEKQTQFSWLLMLATIVLSLSAFLQVILQVVQLPKDFYATLQSTLGFWGKLIFVIGLLFIITLMGGIIYLIFNAFNKK